MVDEKPGRHGDLPLRNVLHIMRAFRVVTVCIVVFMAYWGWDAYLFVNAHIKTLTQWQLVYYGTLIAANVAVVKYWMTTSAAPPHKPPANEGE